ncbi:MAG: beta-galactosidase [Clostridia bacterium]|nr:beta-galactosidase [Clostridia bacterium]
MFETIRKLLCMLLPGALVLGAVACTPVPDEPIQGNTESTTLSQTSDDTTESLEETTQENTDMKAQREIGERYYIYRIWNFTPQTQAQFEQTVDAAAETGFNAIKVHIPWSRVESTTAGEYDFSAFDPMIEYVVKTKGLKVAISIDLTRRADDKVIGLDQMQRDPAGNLCQGGSIDGMRTVISFCSESAVGAAVAFYEDAVKRYDALYGDDILFYLPAFTQYAETEYWPAGEYDYSDLAKNAFRAFLKDKYGDIAALNVIIGTNYSDFSQVEPPSCTASDNLGVLWYQFRHQKLKGFIDALAKVQKDAAPKSKLALQFGSHFDAASLLRCTLNAGDLAENADVVWIDDGPISEHEFSMDYADATFAPSVLLAQEIDGPNQVGATPEKYLEQGMDAYSRGCTYLSIANWTIDADYESYKWVWEQLASTWLGDNPPPVIDTADTSIQMEIKLSQMLRRGNPYAYITEYYNIAPNGEYVNIHVINDLTAVAVDKPQSVFSFPGGYSTEQGKGGWYYMCAQPGKDKLYEMTFDAANNRWQGKAPYSLIMGGAVHPDAYDTVLAFEAPADGTVKYSFNVSVSSPESDGIRYRVMHERTVVSQGDAQGYIHVPYGTIGQDTIEITVKKGDMIWIAINPGETTAYDSTALSVEIEYVQ